MNCEVPGFLLPRAIKDCCTFSQWRQPAPTTLGSHTRILSPGLSHSVLVE